MYFVTTNIVYISSIMQVLINIFFKYIIIYNYYK